MRNNSLMPLTDRVKGTASRLAALFVLAVVLVASILSPAFADNSRTCPGKDVLLQLRKTDPALYGTMLDAASRVENGYSIFWKIEKPGTKPSWLYGTMHSNDERVLKLPTAFHSAFDKIDTLVLELKEIAEPNTIAMELLKHPELTMLPPGKSLDHILPAEETGQIEAGLAKKGVPIATVLRMRPWFIYISLLTCAAGQGPNDKYVLDRQLAVQAARNGIDVEGLETPLEQFQAMADLSDDLTMKGLLESFRSPYDVNDITETFVGLYSTGNSGLMKALVEGLSDDKATDAAIVKRIVTDRNEVMAKRIVPYLEKGNVMMAVGALHLPGDHGVVALLRKQGFTVTPVN